MTSCAASPGELEGARGGRFPGGGSPKNPQRGGPHFFPRAGGIMVILFFPGGGRGKIDHHFSPGAGSLEPEVPHFKERLGGFWLHLKERAGGGRPEAAPRACPRLADAPVARMADQSRAPARAAPPSGQRRSCFL